MTSEQQPFYIGRYRVTARLGAGGMGVVYLATDERLHRQVAVKCLQENPTSANAPQRIRQEALLLAQLNHPNIVQIYDVVEEETEDGDNLALVMEFVDGCTLNQWQRERTPSLRQRVALLKQICHGLARAHSAGIIHRDLKADNILVDENGTAKITDFGIAKNWRQHSDLTREQHIAGSWGAMSPEQALGKPLDNRCDLFALGVLAYRLLCGQNPFGDHESPFVIVDRIVNSEHPSACKLNPDLPPALSHLLDRLLAKEPDKRPLHASAVAEELGNILQQLAGDVGESTASLTATVTAEAFHQRRQRFGSLRRWLAGGGIAAVASSIVAGTLLLSQAKPETSGQYIAIVAPAENSLKSRETRQLGNNVLSALKQDLSNREGLLLVPYSESQQLAGKSLRDQAEALNADLLLHPSLSCNIEQCETALELIDADSLAVVASRSTLLAVDESTESRARILQQMNKLLPAHATRSSTVAFDLSDADYERYLRVFELRDDDAHVPQYLDELEQLQQRAPAFTPLYRMFAELAIDQRYNSRDLAATERLEKFIDRAPPTITDHPDLLSARLRLAVYREDRATAEQLLERLKLILPDRANYHFLKAAAHQHLGDYEEALANADRALTLRRSYTHMVQKAMALSAGGQMEAARPLLLQALTMSENNIDALSLLAANELDSGNPQETLRLLGSLGLDNMGPMDLYNLCLAHYIERQFERADQCFAKQSQWSPGDAETLLYRAEIANAQQKPERARKFAEQALSVVDGRDDWEGLLMQARAHAELGESAPAIEKLIRIGRDAPDDIYVNFARAQVYVTTGDLYSAKAHLRKTLDLGLSPIWFGTAPFAPVCEQEQFADLRRDYPDLCSGNRVARTAAAGTGEG
ncbi:serine/threonine-protein kinase [Microbulbifer guangxiensis]|uniref:serine/threonine-protein kinase n=1 Tax=Microbulbifer guangxiensis TaxID=2904249 RepID=UPI001F02C93C|nr:serine/threonine-protein kinase [Microbulbifer guangxiensis]